MMDGPERIAFALTRVGLKVREQLCQRGFVDKAAAPFSTWGSVISTELDLPFERLGENVLEGHG